MVLSGRWIDVSSRSCLSRDYLAKNRFRVYTQCNEIIIYFHSVAIIEIDSIFFLHFVSSRPSTTAIISRNRGSLWNVYNISSGSNKWNIKG